MLLVQFENQFIFFLGPFAFLDIRIKIVEPSFSALFSTSSNNVVGGLSPLVGTFTFNPGNQLLIFFRGPGTLDKTRSEDLAPSVEALDGGSARNVLADLAPLLFTKEVDVFSEEVVFFNGPFARLLGVLRNLEIGG